MKYPYYEKNQNKFFIASNNSSYSFPSHFHSFIEIAHCFSGIQLVKIDGHTYELKAGDAILIFPYVTHEYIDSGNCTTETKSISIMCNISDFLNNFPIFSKYHPTNPLIKSEFISKDAKLAFAKMLETNDVLERIGWTYIICADLLKSLDLTAKNSVDNPELAVIITTYINENFGENLTIPILASKLGYSSSYIAHIFCDQLKIPFRTYLNSVRCEYAAVQICTTTKSITSIAYESGFNSLNTFCRCFKKNFNMTPLQYKKNNLECV